MSSSGHGEIFLDANENPYESNVNRYPDPMQLEIKHRWIEPNQASMRVRFCRQWQR